MPFRTVNAAAPFTRNSLIQLYGRPADFKDAYCFVRMHSPFHRAWITSLRVSSRELLGMRFSPALDMNTLSHNRSFRCPVI